MVPSLCFQTSYLLTESTAKKTISIVVGGRPQDDSIMVQSNEKEKSNKKIDINFIQD